jgi:putative transposase
MWAHLNREGVQVARCTVERLMRANGWHGATRAKKVRTPIPDPAATRTPDLVNRPFRGRHRTGYWSDFVYVRTLTRFCETAFDIDAFADLIVGWECSMSKRTTFIEHAIAQAAALRARQANP